jgi:hypothetical protein
MMQLGGGRGDGGANRGYLIWSTDYFNDLTLRLSISLLLPVFVKTYEDVVFKSLLKYWT